VESCCCHGSKRSDGTPLLSEAESEHEAEVTDGSTEGKPPKKFWGRNVVKLLAQIGKHTVRKERKGKAEEKEAGEMYEKKVVKISADITQRQQQYDALS